MGVQWRKAAGWVVVLLIFYGIAIYFLQGCAMKRPRTFDNGDEMPMGGVPNHEQNQI